MFLCHAILRKHAIMPLLLFLLIIYIMLIFHIMFFMLRFHKSALCYLWALPWALCFYYYCLCLCARFYYCFLCCLWAPRAMRACHENLMRAPLLFMPPSCALDAAMPPPRLPLPLLLWWWDVDAMLRDDAPMPARAALCAARAPRRAARAAAIIGASAHIIILLITSRYWRRYFYYATPLRMLARARAAMALFMPPLLRAALAAPIIYGTLATIDAVLRHL